MRLADELILLAYADEGTPEVARPTLDFGLAGAVLLELAMAERLDVRDGRLVVTDATPVGDPVLDSALAEIGADDKPLTSQRWVDKLSKGLRDEILDGLVESGVLRREQSRALGIFPRTRFASAHGVEPPEEVDARRRVLRALDAAEPVDARTAALAVLVTATRMTRKVFPGRGAKDVETRVRAIAAESLADDGWAADGMRKAVEAVEAAVIASIVAATAAAAGTAVT